MPVCTLPAAILKNLSFGTVQAMVLRIRPVSKVLIQWQLNPTTQDVSRLKYFIDRGESPSDMKPIAGPIAFDALPEFVDATPKLIDLHKTYSYQVRAVEYNCTTPVQTFTSSSFTWDSQLDLTALYIVEENDWANENVYGVPCMIFKRKREGVHCTECWDAVLRRVTKSSCDTCKGTGWMGGFYPPIERWIRFQSVDISPQVTDLGDKQNRKTQLQITNYPVLTDGDIVVEMESNHFWKIGQVSNSLKNGNPVIQNANVNQVNPSDIEYNLAVDEDRRRALVAQLRQLRQTSEFA